MSHAIPSIQSTSYLPFLAKEDETRQEIMQLFDISGIGASVEQLLEKRLSQRIWDFLRSPYISTDIDVKTLASYFTDSQMPAGTSNVDEYLDFLDERVVTHSTHTASPRFIGHMTMALPNFMLPLAKLMVAMNQNVVKMETAKALSLYERQALAMLHRLTFDYPEDFYQQHAQCSQNTLGILVSGGTAANITALWCARNKIFGPNDGFAGIAQEGLPAALAHYGYTGAVIMGSSLMHYSIEKAADLLGIGSKGLIRIQANHQNQIDLAALQDAIETCRSRRLCIIALVGVAGTTDSGGVDPLEAMGRIAHREGIHFHVDAAWGGPLLFSDEHHHKLAGIERADTVVIDGHKQMYLPMGIGMLLLRDPILAKSIEKQASYIVRNGSIDLGKRALEGSRPGMVLFLHAALHILGRQGYGFLIDEGIRKTCYLADAIRSRAEFELLAEPTINILTYRYLPKPWRQFAATGQLTDANNLQINRFNECLQKLQRQAGRTFVSRTRTNTTRYGTDTPIVALRAVLANPLTTEDDIEAVLEDQCNIADELSACGEFSHVN